MDISFERCEKAPSAPLTDFLVVDAAPRLLPRSRRQHFCNAQIAIKEQGKQNL